jgi:hypothetical protein
VLFGAIGFVSTPAASQQASANSAKELNDLFIFFYKDPRPERLEGYVQKVESPLGWAGYPPLVGLLSIVFREHPDWIERLAPAQLNPLTAETIAAAVRLSGRPMPPSLRSRIEAAGSDEKLRSALSGLPSRPEDLRVTTPTHLDILWGAAFASGDGRFVSMIIDFFANTANRSDPVAMDVVRTTAAQMGGPKEVLSELKGKYGEVAAREIVFASAALWALQVNARQHPFVEQALHKYVADHAQSPATKVLALLEQQRKH